MIALVMCNDHSHSPDLGKINTSIFTTQRDVFYTTIEQIREGICKTCIENKTMNL